MGRPGPTGSSMHLRADAKMLAAAVHAAVDQFGSRQYKAKQQAGMTADLSWKAPAAEWEQVCACMWDCFSAEHVYGRLARPVLSVMFDLDICVLCYYCCTCCAHFQV